MKSPLRLLYLLPADGFGGAERQGVEHLAELPRHGVSVTGFVGSSPALARELSALHVDCEELPQFPPAARWAGESVDRALDVASAGAAFLGSAAEIERRVRGRSFDFIFANRTLAWLVAAVLSRRLSIPYVIRAGSRPAHPVLGPALSLLNLSAKPAAVFYNCLAVKRSIASRFDCPAYELPNVVDVQRFAPASDAERDEARAELGLPAGAALVGLAARPSPEKGFDFFASIVAKVLAVNSRARFVVAGDFPFRARYEAQLRSLGLGRAVSFLGHVGDVGSFFRAVDVVVLTSRERSIEASPNALLEAMASGRSIVATGVGGVPELVRHGVEGLLTRDGDADGFAAHLLHLIETPRHRAELGQRGRARAVARHRPCEVVERLVHDLLTVPHAALELSSLGAQCESNIPSAPLSTFSYDGLPSRPSWSSPDAAI